MYVLKNEQGGVTARMSDFAGKNVEGAIHVESECFDDAYDLSADNQTWVLNPAKMTPALWQAATMYVESQINAAEYAKTLTLTANTRAIANLAWYDGVWQDYYTRTANPVDMDFSNNGEKPYKFWQIMELQG